MKQILLLIFSGFISLSVLQGQQLASVPLGIQFQAVARNVDGQVRSDSPVFLRISLTSADEAPQAY